MQGKTFLYSSPCQYLTSLDFIFFNCFLLEKVAGLYIIDQLMENQILAQIKKKILYMQKRKFSLYALKVPSRI